MATTKTLPTAGAQGKGAPRPFRHPITQRGGYRRCPLSAAEVAALDLTIIRGRGDAAIANSEAERVAHNVAAALSDPARQPAVRAAVRSYTSAHLRLLCVEADFKSDPELAYALLPVAWRRISRVPFIPDRAYIEALTGDDSRLAELALSTEAAKMYADS